MGNMEFTFGNETYHWQILSDEASGIANATFLFKHNEKESKSPTTQQILTNVMQSWVQYLGFPQKIKLDQEGAHRGRELDASADSHGSSHPQQPSGKPHWQAA